MSTKIPGLVHQGLLAPQGLTVLPIIRYWLRISKNSETDTLVKDVLQDNYVMFQNKKDCWLSCVYMIMKDFTLLRFFNNSQAMARRHLTDLKKPLQSKIVTEYD